MAPRSMNVPYPWQDHFQLQILAMLVRLPRAFLGIVDPSRFRRSYDVEIATAAKAIYEAVGPKRVVSHGVLQEIIRRRLEGRQLDTEEMQDNVGVHLHEIYKLPNLLNDVATVGMMLQDFRREAMVRETFFAMEDALTRQRGHEYVNKLWMETWQQMGGQGPEGIRRFIDLPWAEQLQMVPDNTDAIEKLIVDGGLNFVVGKPGSGKSLVVDFMGHALASHVPFLDRKTARLRHVVHIDLENGRAEMKRRWGTFGLSHPFLRAWCLDDPKGCPPKDLNNPIYETLAGRHKNMLILDPLSFFSNKIIDAEEIVPVLWNLKMLAARTGAPIVVVHHASDKDDRNTYLGSTMIRAVIDAGYFIEAKSKVGNPAVRYLEMWGLKDRRGNQAELSIKVDWAAGTFEQEEVSPRENLMKRYEKLKKESPDISQRQAAEKLGVDRQRIRTLLKNYRP